MSLSTFGQTCCLEIKESSASPKASATPQGIFQFSKLLSPEKPITNAKKKSKDHVLALLQISSL